MRLCAISTWKLGAINKMLPFFLIFAGIFTVGFLGIKKDPVVTLTVQDPIGENAVRFDFAGITAADYIQNLYYKTSGAPSYTLIANLERITNTYTLTGLTGSTTYNAYMTFVNGSKTLTTAVITFETAQATVSGV